MRLIVQNLLLAPLRLVRSIRRSAYTRQKNRSILAELDLKPIGKASALLVEAASCLRSLVQNAGAIITPLSEGNVRIEISGLAIEVSTVEDIWIVEEIFAKNSYRFSISRPSVVWDIGMNIGVGSLFFAANHGTLAVFGYEIFKDTYQLALKNFSLNPGVAAKIRSFPFGIGPENADLVLDYCSKWKGSIGINRKPPQEANRLKFEKRAVHVVDASSVLSQIKSEFPDVALVVKMDCEGAEYGIIERLFEDGKLAFTDAFIMEWHDREQNQALIQRLVRAGFFVFSPLTNAEQQYGMLYASRID